MCTHGQSVDGKTHHSIVKQLGTPSIKKKKVPIEVLCDPCLHTPIPIPTGGLSCFRGNGQVVGSLYGLILGPQ